MTNDNISAKDELYSPDAENGDTVVNNEQADSVDRIREVDKLNDESVLSDGVREAEADDESPAVTKPAQRNSTPIEVVGVRFKANGKIYYFAPNGTEYANGNNVIVDTSRGIEFGTVCMPNREISSSEIVLPIRNVVRFATKEDVERRRKNEELEIAAFNKFIERIDAHNLEMKLIDVECAFDNSKLLFYFSAENRIDFRELVRELAGIFHTRIELRQIGIRDEAKMLGGLGICGRPFCCSSFLSDFVQVSIKMAKEQNLSLNSAKISGACGRLMCCLRYEYDTYLAEKALTPKVGAEVMTPDGEGVVSDANPMTGIVKVKLCGTAEDDAPAVFVREDLVLKANYKGEKLTKTPLPEKRAPITQQATFEVRSPFADTVKERPIAEQTERAEKETKREIDRGGRNDRKQDRQKDNSASNGKPQGNPVPSAEAFKSQQGQQKHGNNSKHGKTHKNSHHGGQRDNPNNKANNNNGGNNNKPQNANNGGNKPQNGSGINNNKQQNANGGAPRSGQQQGNSGRNNRHRPFHHHGKPKSNGGNNAGGGSN